MFGFSSMPAAVLTIALASPAYAQTVLPEVRVEDARSTPLNTDSPADSASRLGLTVREIPATVEVIDQATIRNRGYRTITDAAQGAVGVTAGDAPGAPGNFSMRGFSFGQLNTLYNGIKIGPSSMTSRIMDTGNLDRIEFLKGPSSLMSGEGAAGGAVNFVTKRPHSGPIENEAFASYGSFNTIRAGFGSGGSTSKEGLDYRFDLNRSTSSGFIDDTSSENVHLSTGLDFRVSSGLKLFGAFEYKQDRNKAYWGTPLVSTAFSGANSTSTIVAGNYVSNFNGTDLGTVTIDNRALKANYNVLDNDNRADQYFLRGGFEWKLNDTVTLRDQVYAFTATRIFFNSEVHAFNSGTGLVDNDRFFVGHKQKLIGNKAELQWDTKPAGMDNRTVVAFEVSRLNFDPQQAANFPADTTAVVDPVRTTYGPLLIQQLNTRTGNTALAVEDRLKITPAFGVIAGLRYEEITLDRTATDATGALRPNFPFSASFRPTTGRLGFTWETMPGLMLFSQYATGADVASNSLFSLGPLQQQSLTTARTYEAGVKQQFWERKAEWSFSLFDIERKNVYTDQSGHTLNIAGKQKSKGVEIAAAVRTGRWNVWGNAAYTRAYYDDYVFAGGDFTGKTPPNAPKIVANAGTSYRFGTTQPIETGVAVRHVGDRFNSDLNSVTMLAYTVTDAFVFMDVKKSTRITARVRNLTDRKYAIWGDPGYPDQILLGAPRSYELSALLKF